MDELKSHINLNLKLRSSYIVVINIANICIINYFYTSKNIHICTIMFGFFLYSNFIISSIQRLIFELSGDNSRNAIGKSNLPIVNQQ